MRSENNNTVIEFILLGLSSDPSVQIILFHLFLVAYTATLAGNVLLMVAVRTDSRLHRPMYFFLTNLSFMDICYTSIIVPKMLADFLATRKSISFTGCTVQIYFYLFLGESECILLAFMAYDRFVAICNPLRYSTLMNIRVCARMITVVWTMGCIISSVDIYFLVPLAFCGPNIIDHFFCEAPSLLQLSCSDISINNILRLLGSAILLPVPLVLILFSYIRIIMSILRIHHGQYKSFSTCFSHLVVVVIFYGTAMFMYMRPRHSVTDATDKMVSLFYTIITPMLNPVIYSLRNKDVHKALRTLKQGSIFVKSLDAFIIQHR